MRPFESTWQVKKHEAVELNTHHSTGVLHIHNVYLCQVQCHDTVCSTSRVSRSLDVRFHTHGFALPLTRLTAHISHTRHRIMALAAR